MTTNGFQPYRRWRKALFWTSVLLGVLAVLAVVGLGVTAVAESGGPASFAHPPHSEQGPEGRGR